MMPTIRIDNDVFNGLKAIAEPFIDTPNTVIRRLLESVGTLHQQGAPVKVPPDDQAQTSKAKGVIPALGSRSTRTRQSVYETFLLYVLANEFDGAAQKFECTKRVIEVMQSRGFIGGAELNKVSSGETRAENTIAWGRNALKDRGLISQTSPKGKWELTEEGLKHGKLLDLPAK